ncbi:MAG: hypothetical protein ACI4U9_00420 [Clostridia bacterium]
MRHFNRNEKLGFFEELVWDHFFNEETGKVERGNVNNEFIILCIMLGIVTLAFICFVVA